MEWDGTSTMTQYSPENAEHFTRQRSVRVIVPTSLTYGRNIAHGVLEYSRLHGPWTVQVEDVSSLNLAVGALPDGLIVHCSNANVADRVRALQRPIVNVSGMLDPPPFPSVLPDNVGIGRLVAMHFCDRGFQHFGYFGYPGHAYSQQRFHGFSCELSELGFTCEDAFTETNSGHSPHAKQAAAEQRKNWLQRQEMPLAIMACNDSRARQACIAAMEGGLLIPDQVAIVGVDNDELECETAGLRLSSVDVNADKIGFTAAELLEDLVRGGNVPRVPLLIPPKGVVVRQSSDVLALGDSDVRLAVRFIRENFRRGIQVDDVVEATGLSRRNLEQRFRAAVGRPIHAEIRRAQLNKARELLASSDLSIHEVAKACGFSAPYYLSTSFRKEYDETPREYRRKFQKR